MVGRYFQIPLRLWASPHIGLLGGCVASLSFTLTYISPSLCWNKFNLCTPHLCDRRVHQSHVVSHNSKSLMILITFSRYTEDPVYVIWYVKWQEEWLQVPREWWRINVLYFFIYLNTGIEMCCLCSPTKFLSNLFSFGRLLFLSNKRI